MKKIDFKFIDVHCHMMYAVDDGPKTKEMSADMMKIAMDENIETVLLTPHYHPAKCTRDYEELSQNFEEFQQFANQVCPELKFVLGREIYYTSDILDELEEGKKLSLGSEKYILVEFDPFTDYNYLHTAVNNISQEGYIPVVAHIERYQCIVKDWHRALELSDMGAVIQVNASSVIGDAGSTIKKFIKNLMKNELVDLVGTDAHSNNRRAPRMRECAQYICKKYGYEYARKILRDNAGLIINGEYLED